jgi:lipoate-protein ligase A
MKTIRLLDLGTVSSVRSQTCYHAAAYALAEDSPDTIIFVRPSGPYVCIGYHQDLEKEVDLEYCRTRGLPVYRREVGGGAVYLDANQVFIQWIFHPSALPSGVADRFRLYAEPLVLTYRSLGIEARYRPVNDIHAGSKKIGGTGAAQIGGAEVVVGSFMFDFDRAAMARVLRVSSEKMRDKIHQSFEQYMTTVRDELGREPDREQIKAIYMDNCACTLGAEIVPGEWTSAEEKLAEELDRRFASPEWLGQKGALRRHGVKVHEDVGVREADHKAPGGVLRVTLRLREGRIDDVSISGDFVLYPRTAVTAIEGALRGVEARPQAVLEIVSANYEALAIESPGLGPEDWTAVFASALEA